MRRINMGKHFAYISIIIACFFCFGFKFGTGPSFKVGTGAGVKLERAYMENFVEVFIDEVNIESKTGVTLSVNRPTKYANNPIISASQINDWDEQYWFNYFSFVQNDDGTYTGWYSAKDDANSIHSAKMESNNDASTWTKPDLDLITYDGTTDNNLMIANRWCISAKHFPERASDQQYIAAMYDSTVAGGMAALHKSADGENWTLLKTIMTGTSYPEGTLEIKDFLQRSSDGKWIVYCTTGHNTNRRKTVAFLSDTTDPSGTWSYAPGYTNGVILSCTSYTDQKYHPAVKEITPGVFLHQVAEYHSDNTVTCGRVGGYFPYIQLYVSRDGLAMTAIDLQWIALGASGTWDDTLIYPLHDLLRFGDTWRIYYQGSGEDHNNCVWKTHFIGYADIGYRRIGQIASTGSFITDERTTSDILVVNCDATGGTLKAELLDPEDDSVLTGYAQSDCDAISVNSFEKIATWNGVSALPAGNFKIKFYLTDANLYSYSVCAWQ